MRTLHVDTWPEFTRLCERYDGWAFRGQRDASWPLLSTLSRHFGRHRLAPSQWRGREERALRIFRRKAHFHLPDRSVLQDTLRTLALMQHYGGPTRLLDFTKSPFVAAFFAVEQATGASAVYALNTPLLWSANGQAESQVSRDDIDPRVPGNFERYFVENQFPLVWFGEPTEMDRRLVAQSGLVVMPGTLASTLDEILTSYRTDLPLIEKIVLDPALRAEAMRALYRMNITQATLFPDLEGLARSLWYELEESWPLGTKRP